MSRDHARSIGLRFTFRHSLILVLYIAILFTVINPLLGRFGYTNSGKILPAALLFSPPLLALLAVVIERAGPLRNWVVSFTIVLFYPAMMLYHDRSILLDYLESGRRPTLWTTLLLNVMVLTCSLAHLVAMVPRDCPGCRRRTLVPLMRLFKEEKRSANTRWCASCGAKYWKDREGNWRVERRQTWLDRPAEPATTGGRPEVPASAHRPIGRRELMETRPS